MRSPDLRRGNSCPEWAFSRLPITGTFLAVVGVVKKGPNDREFDAPWERKNGLNRTQFSQFERSCQEALFSMFRIGRTSIVFRSKAGFFVCVLAYCVFN